MLASSTLEHITEFQERFRKDDLDRNGRADYWRGELRRLLTLTEGALPYARLEGAADLEEPFQVRAIGFPNESRPDPSRFAACCFPVKYAPGIRSHYVVREDGVVWKKDLGHADGIDVYPADPLGEGWSKVD